MKRILMGATALAGAALTMGLPTSVAAQAVAASAPFSVRIQGFTSQNFVVLGANRSSGTRSHDFYSDSEIQVTVTGKADNGLTYGFRAEFEVDATATNNIDENSIFFQGSWGRVEIGQNDSPNDLENALPLGACRGSGDDCIGSGGPLAIIAASAKRAAAAGGAAISLEGRAHLLDSSDAGKIIYTSPKFSGFSVNLSYAPSVGTGSEGQNFAFTKAGGDRRDAIELGALYEGKFGAVELEARLAYTYISVEDQGTNRFEDVNAFGGGLTLGVGGFKVGVAGGYDGKGRYRKVDATRRFDDPQWFVAGRAEYGFGPWVFGVGAQYETSEGDQTLSGDEELFAVGAQVSYTIAPGLRLLGEIAYVDFQDDDLAGTTNINRDLNATVFTVTTRLRF